MGSYFHSPSTMNLYCKRTKSRHAAAAMSRWQSRCHNAAEQHQATRQGVTRHDGCSASTQTFLPVATQAYLVHARWQQLHDGVLLARPLQHLSCGPVVERPFYLHVVAPMAPWHEHAAADPNACARGSSSAQQGFVLLAMLLRAHDVAGHAPPCHASHSHTMTTGTSLGVAGHPACPWNSGPAGRRSSAFTMGSCIAAHDFIVMAC